MTQKGKMGKPLIIYHGNCYDGFGAAWAAWKKFGDGAEYRPYFYGKEPPNDWWDRDCYVLDFSFPSKVIGDRQLDQSYTLNLTDFRVLDHHKTAEADLKDYPGCCTFDMDKSGAVLAWEFFHPYANVPKLLRYIQDRDLWKFEMSYSREVSQWMRSWPFDFQKWSEIAEEMISYDNFNKIVAEGSAMLRFQDQMVSAMCDNATFQDVGGHSVPVVNATVFFSEVGEELCKRYPEAPFAAYYLDRKDGKRQWGLRSRNGFDVSEVAKMFSGGGHAAAAGFVQ